MQKKWIIGSGALVLTLITMVFFQNCSKNNFTDASLKTNPSKSGLPVDPPIAIINETPACDLPFPG